MIIGWKDTVKLFSISIVACCAVFVCTLFLNYNTDLTAMEHMITSPTGIVMYHAQVSMGRVTAGVTGGCLVMTSVVMLLFYVKNYIDTHGKELGILKALGYSNMKIATHFWVFGLSVLFGCALGFAAAFLYLPAFYEAQNADGLLPVMEARFHPVLLLLSVGAPSVLFAAVSVLYANWKLRGPVLDLLREKRKFKAKFGKAGADDAPFLKGLSACTLKSKKTLVFFVAFSAFCFSAMVQMALSMNKLSSETFSWMILMIGLILAFMTLFLSLSSVVKGNTKTIAMMKVFGYDQKTCSQAILGAYRPVSYIGFVIGTAYQYGLLKFVMTFVFDELENMPEYNFNFKALVITLIAFVITYELAMYLYSVRINKLSIKSVMLE